MSLLNKLVVATLPAVPKSIVGLFSRRYIAGVSLQDAVRAVQGLNRNGMMATLDILGEEIHERSSALSLRGEWVKVLDEIEHWKLDSNISVKLTQLGLRIDKDFCYDNLRFIVDGARRYGNFVRIDMEDSTTTDDALELYRRLRSEGYGNVGVVIQAYLHRSERDVVGLAREGANFRLCKGIYIESPQIAFTDREEIRRNFVRLLDIMMAGRCYVGIATHDSYLIERARELVAQYGLRREEYEFQMLLGVRERLRDGLVREGHRLRVYVPFGEQWYAYSVRRLKENPQIAGYVFRAIFMRERVNGAD